jgi:endogenous inhibitor of DNA gyrase (YacG/DUF329 family)
MIQFNCPICGKNVTAPDDKAGRLGKCICGNRVRVPIGQRSENAGKLSGTEPPPSTPNTDCDVVLKNLAQLSLAQKARDRASWVGNAITAEPTQDVNKKAGLSSESYQPGEKQDGICFACPRCGKTIFASNENAGLIAVCVCGNTMRIPMPPEPPRSAANPGRQQERAIAGNAFTVEPIQDAPEKASYPFASVPVRPPNAAQKRESPSYAEQYAKMKLDEEARKRERHEKAKGFGQTVATGCGVFLVLLLCLSLLGVITGSPSSSSSSSSSAHSIPCPVCHEVVDWDNYNWNMNCCQRCFFNIAQKLRP